MSAASSVTSDQQNSQTVNEETEVNAEASNGERTHQIYLYVKVSNCYILKCFIYNQLFNINVQALQLKHLDY